MIKYNEIIRNNHDFLKNNINIYFSPGRVNLIGDHIDYLGGNVFPTAINLGIYAFVTKRDDNQFHFLSENFKSYGEKVISLEDTSYKVTDHWTNYAKGMIDYYIKKKYKIHKGLNVLLYGNLPNGAGLSSSASVEVLMGVILRDEFHLDINMIDIAKIAKDVENNYIGVNCGIMDQFAVGMSKKNTAIYLDTNTLKYSLVPLDLGNYTLIIANTNKKRALVDSKYNERKNECDEGFRILQENNIKIKNLCDLTIDQYKKVSNYFENKVIRNRVEHAVYENNRTIKAVEALKEGSLIKFGNLMNQSHDSLRDLYEVSCHELNILVNSFRKNEAIGSRMTGAGFGGCVIALVESKKVETIIKNVKKDYIDKIGYNADFYPVETHDGAKKLDVRI